MGFEQENLAERNAALLDFLAGRWETWLTLFVHREMEKSGARLELRFGGVKARSLFRSLPGGGVAGHHLAIEHPPGEEEAPAEAECFLQLELDRSDNTLVAHLGNDRSVPGLRGVWSDSALFFRGDFHEGIPLWEAFQVFEQRVTGRPSTVSLLLRQASGSSWLLDVEFLVEQPSPSETKPLVLRCRAELWHSRGPNPAPPHPEDVEERFDQVLRRCDEITQDVEFQISEIDDQLAALEESRARCEERLRLLGEVKSNAESGKGDADSLGGDLRDALLELHAKPTGPTECPAGAGGTEAALTRTWSELAALWADSESLDTELDSIEADVDFPDDLIAAAWANAEYARGLNLLRENRNHLPPPDLSFLGSLQPSVSKLSKDATKIVRTTAVWVQVALHDEASVELEYGPPIASMAKACERILSEVFQEKRGAIESNPASGSFLSDVGAWEYRIPADMTDVTSGALKEVAKMVRKSVETSAPIKWTGMGHKRIALLLFGGWVPVYQATAEHFLNPLGVNRSAEFVRTLPDRISEFQKLRNGFVHHDLADRDDLLRTWACFQDCLKGLLQAFYSGSE